MKLELINEKTGKTFSREIPGKSIDDYFKIEYDFVTEELETKYNATMDFTGYDDCICYSIYEIDDESLFELILEELYKFIQNNPKEHHAKKIQSKL